VAMVPGFLDLAGRKKARFSISDPRYWRTDPVLQIFFLTGEKPRARLACRGLRSSNGTGRPHQLHRPAVANCEKSEHCCLNDRSLGRLGLTTMFIRRDWSVPYAPGVLSAVGYRAGKQVAAQELRTTGAPARLQVTPIASPLPATSQLYEITVVDEAGLKVSDATPAVTVKSKAPAASSASTPETSAMAVSSKRTPATHFRAVSSPRCNGPRRQARSCLSPFHRS